jgi:hypothetical protein
MTKAELLTEIQTKADQYRGVDLGFPYITRPHSWRKSDLEAVSHRLDLALEAKRSGNETRARALFFGYELN